MPISGITTKPLDQEAVELHWMKESDLAMSSMNGLTAPALCGAWVDPDPVLTAAISGRLRVRYVRCTQCDLLADLRTEAMAV